MIKDLISLSNGLDSSGLYKEANKLDLMIKKISYSFGGNPFHPRDGKGSYEKFYLNLMEIDFPEVTRKTYDMEEAEKLVATLQELEINPESFAYYDQENGLVRFIIPIVEITEKERLSFLLIALSVIREELHNVGYDLSYKEIEVKNAYR